MTRREKIQETLGGFNISPMRAALITDALLAAIEPDEAKLRLIIQEYCEHKTITSECLACSELIIRLLKWARCEPERPQDWCSHIFLDNRAHLYQSLWIYSAMHGDERVNLVVPDNWGQCPIARCGAKRPG